MGILVFLGLAAGCSTTPPPPEEMARTVTETAPADLQLMCASAAAAPSGVDSAKILPTGSRRVDARTFNVDLDAGGRKFACLIDDSGTVTSVQPA
nr:hypothetical protein [Fererhizobium litorale]